MIGIRTALMFSVVEKYGSFLITFFSSLILARLLTPSEIGVYSVGAAAVGIISTFRDFGITNYLIQERNLTDTKIRTALLIISIISLALAFFVFILSGFMADYYDEPGIKKVLQVISLNFCLLPLSAISMAMLRRDMRFREIAVIGLASNLVSAICSITLAYFDFGFISLAWGGVSGALTTVVCTRIMGNYVFRQPGYSDWKRIVSFGGFAGGTALANEGTIVAPDLIIGKTLGFESAGLFSRAVGFVNIVNTIVLQALYPVLVPALANKARANEDLKPSMLTAVSYCIAIVWPACAWLSIFAEPAIVLLFGDQWKAASAAASILAVKVAIDSIWVIMGSVLTATGQVEKMFSITSSVLVIEIVSLLAVSSFGLLWISAVLILLSLIRLILIYSAVRTIVGFTLTDFGPQMLHGLLFVGMSVLMSLPFIPHWHGTAVDAWLVVPGGSVSVGVGWIVLLLVLKHPLLGEMKGVLGIKPRMKN